MMAGFMNLTVTVSPSVSPNSSSSPLVSSISRQLTIYSYAVVLLLGLTGNLLSFLVLVRRRMRNTAMYNFLLLLAIADSTVLLSGCLKTWIAMVTGFEALTHSKALCIMLMFITFSAQYISNWLIVLMTVERFTAIWYPLQVKVIWTLARSRSMAAIVMFLGFAINFHVFWTFDHIHWEGRVMCTYDYTIPFMEYGYEYFKFVTYCLLPFIVVLVLNSLIIYRVHNGSALLEQEAGVRSRSSSSSSDSHSERITLLLLTVSFTWFLLMLPYSLVFVPAVHYEPMYRLVAFVLMYTNTSINFLLYCLTGRKFREELLVMFRGCGCQRRRIVKRESTMRTDMATEATALKLFRRNYPSNGKTSCSSSNTSLPTMI